MNNGITIVVITIILNIIAGYSYRYSIIGNNNYNGITITNSNNQ